MAQFKRKSAGAVYTANASFTWTISGIALVACGGGGGGGAPSSIAVSYYDITIYDGPISGAKLYSDVNNNDVIDDDDIFLGETDAHGVVRISQTAGGTAFIANLDGAIDTDNPDEILTNIIWCAPAGSLVVSPLTELLVVAGEDADLFLNNLGLEEIDVKTINPFDTNNATLQDADKTENLIDAARQVGGLIKEDGDVFAISHIASDIENACVITDFSMDDNDWLDFSAYIDALWYDQSRSVNTGEASNDSSQNDTVLYGKADGSEVVIVLEDFSDTDFFMAISRASIELHAFEAEIV